MVRLFSWFIVPARKADQRQKGQESKGALVDVAPGPTISCLPQSALLQQSSSAVQVGGAMPTMSYLLSMEVIKGECAPFDSYVSLSRHAQSTIGRAQRANLTSALRWTESKQTGKSYGRVRRSKVQYDV